MKVNSTTWCSENNLAGKYLADTLEMIGDEKLIQKVNVYFNRFYIRTKALNVLDEQLKMFYFQLLLDKFKFDVDINIRHSKVRSLMLNVIKSIYRQELIKINLK